MDIFNCYFVISIILSAIPALHSLSYIECDERSQRCLNRFDIIARDRTDLCQEGLTAVLCAKRLECPSIIYGLVTYRHVVRELYRANVLDCDLGNFLSDFPSDCANNPTLRSCLVTYTDRIMAHMHTTINKDAACEDMNDYVRCQRRWDGKDCDITRETLEQFIEEEKRRLSLQDCEVTAFDGAAMPSQVGILMVTVTSLLARLLTLNLN